MNNEHVKNMVDRSTILRGLVGSTIHGLNVQDGLEDRDEMGVCVEDIEYAMGVEAPFEQYIYRTAVERQQREIAESAQRGESRHPSMHKNGEHPKSRGGDLDLTVFSLRKYVRLALKGNPTVLNLLFIPPMECVTRSARGAQLQELAPFIVSREAGKAYLGYLQAQRQRLTGERGQKDVNRPELVQKYGFDTKYAMHMLRLGYQGVEILETGRLSFPMREPERTWLFGVRQGGATMQDCLTRAGELEQQIKDLLTDSPLPEKPNRPAVEQWMIETYFQMWKAAEFTRFPKLSAPMPFGDPRW